VALVASDEFLKRARVARGGAADLGDERVIGCGQ
jgi:hypothetical protein